MYLLITTASFIAGPASTLVTTTQEMPLDIYSIFVGPPTTGKSQAIKECVVSPMTAVVTETDSSFPVTQKCTSARLIKTIIVLLRTIKRDSFFSVKYTTSYLNQSSPTKRTQQETFKFSVSYFLRKKLPTDTPQKRCARFQRTLLSPY